MTGNQFRYNELPKSRYNVSATINGVKLDLKDTSLGLVWELRLNINYKNLVDELREQLCTNDNASGIQQFRNHLTTLTGFLNAIGKDEDSRVGHEIKSGYVASVNTYIDMLGLSERTKADRRSHLNRWKSIADAIESKARGIAQPLKSFNAALRDSLVASNMSKATLISNTGVSKSVLAQWLSGATPNQRSITAIHRAEKELGLNRGELTNRIKPNSNPFISSYSGEIDYRTRLAESIQNPFKLRPEEVSAELLKEWKDFFRYKTAVIVSLKRTERGVWRLKPIEKCAKTVQEVCINNLTSPSGSIMWASILNFLGFLRLPIDQEGYGLDLREVQTLAWFAHPDAINAYLDFIKSRSGGISHGGHNRICTQVLSLLKSDSGYLAQQPEFIKKLKTSLIPSGMTWEMMCAKTSEVAKVWKKQSKDKSRSTEEPIAALLALPYALDPIFRAIKQLDRNAAGMPSGGVAQARLKRDALLLAFLVSNPLRVLNFKIMTWLPDNTGNLYKDGSKSWRLRFNATDIKTDKPYNVKIANWLVNRLEAYIEEYRSTLLESHRSNYLFISSNASNGEIWDYLHRHIPRLTKKLIPETPGFGAHAFRHLVATDWLRKNPNDYLTVAELLNDRIGTVIKHYAHLKKDQSFDRYENYVVGVMGDNMSK